MQEVSKEQQAHPLSEAELEAVSDRVLEKLQAQIGRSAIRLVFWLVTTGLLAVLGLTAVSQHK